MRTLPSVASGGGFDVPRVTLSVQAADVSTTWVSSHGDILTAPVLRWEGPDRGGFADPVDYLVTLAVPLTDLKARLPILTGGLATLTVQANSDAFTPHVGRVRSYRRLPGAPHAVELHVIDRFKDDNPHFPTSLALDGWTHPHPAELGAALPVLYGVVPTKMPLVAVTSDFSKLVAPQNIQTAPDVLWAQPGADPLAGAWQAGFIRAVPGIFTLAYSVGLVGSAYEARASASSAFMEILAPTINGTGARFLLNTYYVDASSFSPPPASIDFRNDYANLYTSSGAAVQSMSPLTFLHRRGVDVPQLKQLTQFGFQLDTSHVGSGTINLSLKVGYAGNEAIVFSLAGAVVDSTYVGTVAVSAGSPFANMLVNDDQFTTTYYEQSSAGVSAFIFNRVLNYRGGWQATVHPDAYQRRSVIGYTLPASAYTAVTANPVGILAEIFSHHTGTPYVVAQASAAQAAVTSYALSVLMYDRRRLHEIVDEVGRLCDVAMWLGDSGQLNFRTWADSAGATVNRVINHTALLGEGLELVESPLGATLFDGDRVRAATLSYAYDYHLGRFTASQRISRANNAYCNSAHAAGITNEATLETKFIRADAVASLALANEAKHAAVAREYASGRLPFAYVGLEYGDVIDLRDPTIVGSQALYRLKMVELDLRDGTVGFTGVKLPALS